LRCPVLTSSAEKRDIDATYEHHANSYIVKPVDFQQVTEAVRELGIYWPGLNEPPMAADPGRIVRGLAG
jgi:two-component system response regulator